jgi:aryl-alcohol dehydrogenase-like predicted oxidoreductase
MQRRLGKSNIMVSAMGLGCYAIGGEFKVQGDKPWGWTGVDDKESIRAIHAGLDMGINFLDTAMAYGCGHSERVIGKAINGRRDRVILATKFGKQIDEENKIVLGSSITREDIRAGCEASLRRFGTDYIDLFQWHESRGAVEDAPAVLEILDELAQEGKIRFYGWSTDDPERMRAFAGHERCTAVQNGMSLLRYPKEMLALCEEYDLASINRSPLIMGVLTGKFNESSTFDERDVRHSLGYDFSQGDLAEILLAIEKIRPILTSDGRTLAQAALGYIWSKSERTIPIPGFKNVHQVEENAGALAFGPLGEDQVAQVEAILRDLFGEE